MQRQFSIPRAITAPGFPTSEGGHITLTLAPDQPVVFDLTPETEIPEPEPVPLGVALRNQWFLRHYEAVGTDTFHRPKAIADKWNGLTKEERAKICPASVGRVSRGAVKKGIERAQALRSPKRKNGQSRKAGKRPRGIRRK